MYLCIYVRMYERIFLLYIYICLYVCMCVRMYLCVCIYVCMHVRMYACYIHVYKCIYIYIEREREREREREGERERERERGGEREREETERERERKRRKRTREKVLLKMFHYNPYYYLINYVIDSHCWRSHSHTYPLYYFIKGRRAAYLSADIGYCILLFLFYQLCRECCKTERCNSGELIGMRSDAYVITFRVHLLITTASLSLAVNSLL